MICQRVITILIVLIGLCASGCVWPVKIEGTAMRPTLADGDRWLVTLNPGELQRGDIIVFRYPKDETKQYVKRIVGLPGETIEIRDGLVYINGVALPEGYVPAETNKSRTSFPEKRIPEDNYFVIGDNRDNSSDSRYWGTVDKTLIEGKLYSRYFEGKN